MNHEPIYRVAPATLGLLIIYKERQYQIHMVSIAKHIVWN